MKILFIPVIPITCGDNNEFGQPFFLPSSARLRTERDFHARLRTSSQEIAVICALSSGASMTAAAEQAGVHRNTITNWRRNLLPFQHAVADAQYDKAIYSREKVEDLVDLAIQSLYQILTDPKLRRRPRRRHATEPKKQIELNLETVCVGNTTRAQRCTIHSPNLREFASICG